jgi:hypothetical protein
MFVLFLVTRYFPVKSVTSTSMTTLLFSLIGMALVVVANVGENFVIQINVNAMRDFDGVSGYQGFSRSVLVITVLCIGWSSRDANAHVDRDYIRATAFHWGALGVRRLSNSSNGDVALLVANIASRNWSNPTVRCGAGRDHSAI